MRRFLFIAILLIGLCVFGTRNHAAAAPQPSHPMLNEMYVFRPGAPGLLANINQSVFGPNQLTGFGDPFTPISSPYYADQYGVYTYRIAVPYDYPHKLIRVEVFDPDNANALGTNVRRYGVDGTVSGLANCPGSQVDACLRPTPWGGTGDNPNPNWFVKVDEIRNPNATPPSYTAGQPQMTRTVYRLYYLQNQPDGSVAEVDLAYYLGKMDNTLASNGSPGMYTPAQAQAEAKATDLSWVSPGAPKQERMPAFDVFPALITIANQYGATPPLNPSPALTVPAEPETRVERCEAYRLAHYGPPQSGGYTLANGCSGDGNFIVDLMNEVSNPYTDPDTGEWSLYVQVRGITGASENGYDLWAGPARSADGADFRYTVPSNINARQIYVLGSAAPEYLRDTAGIQIYGQKTLPLNSLLGGAPQDIALTYLPPELAGMGMAVKLFDPDFGSKNAIIFYLEGVPLEKWSACFDDEGTVPANTWITCKDLGLPRLGPANIPTHDNWTNYDFLIPEKVGEEAFPGGNLYMRYFAGYQDTFTVLLSMPQP